MKVSTIDLRPGMRLQEDCRALAGRKIFSRGSVLTERMIRTLQAWGIVEVDVEGEEESGQSQNSDLEEFYAVLRPLYLHNDLSFAPVRELFKVAVRRCVSEEKQFLVHIKKKVDIDHKMEKKIGSVGKQEAYDILEKEIQLFSLPDIYYRIMEVINAPHSSAAHVADVVSRDASLSARLLRLVNSPFYGFTQKVDTISRAVALLGTDKLTTLAQGILIVRTFAGIPSDQLDMQEFWAHSVSCGIIARLLASQKVGLDEEMFFLLGLVHDLGRLIVIKELPAAMLDALFYAASKQVPLHRAESRVLGFDHASIGGLLGERWHFPEQIVEGIKFHHRPGLARAKSAAGILHVADVLASGLFLGHSGNVYVPFLERDVWAELSLSPHIIKHIFPQIQKQFQETLKAFL